MINLVDGLCFVPVEDVNYPSFLQRATAADIQMAINIMEANPDGNKGRLAACRRELKKRADKQ